MPQEQDDDSYLYQALSVFTQKYDPAEEDEVTDYFSSQEIQALIYGLVGISIDLPRLYELLTEMCYSYTLQGDNFLWMVRK